MKSMSKLTEKDIATEVTKLAREVEAWDALEKTGNAQLFVYWAGYQVKSIGKRLLKAIMIFLDATADSGRTVEPDAYDCLLAIDEFADHFERYQHGTQMGTVSPGGTDSLWNAWNKILTTQSRPKLRQPTPIKQLVAQQVGLRQIAFTYGWLLPDREPDVVKVEEEIANPGTHYNPETWVHPSRVADLKRLTAEWSQRQPRCKRYETEVSEIVEVPKIPSIEELIRQKVGAAQIARLHKISIDEAQELLDAAGVIEERHVLPANPRVALEERMRREEAAAAK